jgi:DNA-binding response OmpR family regulator
MVVSTASRRRLRSPIYAKIAERRSATAKVLMVEDDPHITECLSLVFQMRWPEAEFVFTHLGRKGVELAKSEAPDIIVLDLGLPDISGFEVLKRIRLFSTVPIIILTACSGEAEMAKGLDLGADEYMLKPFKQLDFLDRMKCLLAR